MSSIRVAHRDDGVAILTFDSPGSSVNTLSRQSLAELEQGVRQVLAEAKTRACVLTSAKEETFLAGADLDEVSGVTDASVAREVSARAHAVLNLIVESEIPFVAAIHGAALGGGLEVALACHGRVATSDAKTSLGLPEVQLGLLPGAGGTQRLVRLIGLRQALPVLLTGSRVRAAKAARLGLVDRVVERSKLLEEAARFALTLKGGVAKSRMSVLDRLLLLPGFRAVILRQARQQVVRQTRGHYPAPVAILDCVQTGLERGLAQGIRRESELFGQLVVSPEAKSLIWIFHATRELKKLPADAAPAAPLTSLGVIGAGLMGEGIAAVSIPLNPVVLKDITESALSRALGRIHASLQKRVEGGSLPQAEATRQKERLRSSMRYEDLAQSELVIEAVFEDLKLKQKVLSEVEAVVAANAVFASNTSALPIRDIAQHALHPERVVGMHYFSPVPKMPLLEIVRAEKSSAGAIHRAQAYGIAQGKTVIVVKDQPGFYTTRILAPLLNEAMLLLEEGASIEAVDGAMKAYGFPVGPILLLDEVGIDVGAHVAQDLGRAFGSRWGRTSAALGKLREAGYLGKKNGKGFYTAQKAPNVEVYPYFGPIGRKPLDRAEIQERISFVMMGEAVHCLQETVLGCARDGDIGAIFGLGFPPFLGGPFHTLDRMGLPEAVRKMKDLASRHGDRFQPAPLLVELASQGRKFYP